VTTTTARPSVLASSRSSSITDSAVLVSSAAVGSSPMRIGGLPPSARAIATRCFWPPDRSAGRWRIREPRPTVSSSRRASASASRAPGSFIRIAIATFSTAVSAGNRLKPWNTKPKLRARSAGSARSPRPATFLPSSQTSPDVGVSRRPRIEIRVVFPEPDGPSIRVTSPARISSVASDSAATAFSPDP